MQINTGISLNRLVLIVTVALVLAACNSSTSVPSGVLPINPMKEIMWDIAQVEVYANQHLVRDSTKNLRNETNQLYQQVFAIHRTNKDQFSESLKYYEAHPPKHKILLDSLMQYANRQRDTLFKKSFQKVKPAINMQPEIK